MGADTGAQSIHLRTTKHTLTKLRPEDKNDEEHEDADNGSSDNLLLVHPGPVNMLSMKEINSLANHLLQSTRSAVDGAIGLQQMVARVLKLLPLATQRVEDASTDVLCLQSHTLGVLQSPRRVRERLGSSKQAGTR